MVVIFRAFCMKYYKTEMRTNIRMTLKTILVETIKYY